MNILFLSPRQGWPPHGGAKLREYHFMRALAKSSSLTYLYFADPGEPPLTHRELPFCEQIVGIPKPASYGVANLARGLFGSLPLQVLNYDSDAMHAALAKLSARVRFDLIHIDSIHMAGYAAELNPARVVYNWHNIESELMRRYGETVPSRARRVYAGLTVGKLQALEQKILRTSFGHIVCSEREQAHLRQIAPGARIAVVENGVETSSFPAPHDPPQTLHRLVFVGRMAFYPNVDAMTTFARNVWPKISERMPALRLSIVGADPTPAVTALREIAGVEVTGTVPDVAPYYRDSLAAIVPLLSGSGTRLKILEAMAARTPVISTEVGAEGLSVSPGCDILIAEAGSAESWIKHLTLLANSPERRAQITSAAFEMVQARYEWEQLGQLLVATYQEWLRSAG